MSAQCESVQVEYASIKKDSTGKHSQYGDVTSLLV